MGATRVLIYNWCPIESREGGGVAVYVRNIVSTLAATDEFEPVFLNSGFYYDTTNPGIHIRPSEVPLWSGCACFDLVNSPVFAPMRSPAENIDAFVHDELLLAAFVEFVREQAIDVVHFNNLEGLSIACLRAKRELPHVRFVYSIHNYTLFCPSVNYWTSDGRNCFQDTERDCSRCMAKYSLPGMQARRRYRMRKDPKLYYFGRAETHALNAVADAVRSGAYNSAEYESLFAAYRTQQVKAINAHIDAVLAVSERVKEIALANGIDDRLLHTEYIGTRFADGQVMRATPSDDDILHVVFMGYMKQEKGFAFLIDALAGMPDEVLRKVALTIAAKLSDPVAYRKMRKLGERLAGLRYLNGYTHDQIPDILRGQDLGIVPVLWEDSMPQVAIELSSMGVPVLASSCGGASELTHSELFKFVGGDAESLRERIGWFVANKAQLEVFWDTKTRLMTMGEHLSRLTSYYVGGDA